MLALTSVGRDRADLRGPWRDAFRSPRPRSTPSSMDPGTPIGDDRIYGFVDDHVHVTGDLRAGGEVISGEPFDSGRRVRAGRGRAGPPPGRERSTSPGTCCAPAARSGRHDTHGWPTFTGWPTFDTKTHRQTYWMWLERAWRGRPADDGRPGRRGRRAVPDEKDAGEACSETATMASPGPHPPGAGELRRRAETAVPGRGWFRLVYSPRAAAQVMREGKAGRDARGRVLGPVRLPSWKGQPAVYERRRRPRARRATRGSASAACSSPTGSTTRSRAQRSRAGSRASLIKALNRLETGRYFRHRKVPAATGRGRTVGTSPRDPAPRRRRAATRRADDRERADADYPGGHRCNARGLTALGVYLVRRMISRAHADRGRPPVRERGGQVLAIAAKAALPADLEHTGTGGAWTPPEMRTSTSSAASPPSPRTSRPSWSQNILSHGEVPGKATNASAAAIWAPTPGAWARSRARVPTGARSRCATRSRPISATSPSFARGRASAHSTWTGDGVTQYG